MKYLLISPPKKGIRMFIESPPVGLGYLATAIRKLGHEVEIKDCLVEDWDIWQTTDYIEETKPDIVGINVFSTSLSSVRDLTTMIKGIVGHKPMVILGGPHCSGSPEHTLNFFAFADYAFRGEAEIPIKEFDEFLKGKRIEGDVTGLIWRQGDKIIANEPIEYANIEEFGMPAWDLIDPRKYFKQVKFFITKFSSYGFNGSTTLDVGFEPPDIALEIIRTGFFLITDGLLGVNSIIICLKIH